MAIVAGLDVHRAQITFDALDPETGEVHRGRIPADRESVRRWVGRFGDARVEVAIEACTGWLFVCEALREAGAVPHLAETAETRARRGTKRRAKTDRADARWLRTLLAEGRLPEAWIPPAHVREWRTRTRAQDAGRRAHQLAGASPSNAVPPRHRRRARQVAAHPRPRLPRRTRAARRRPRTDRGGTGNDRCARSPAGPARARHPGAGASPGRLPGADAPLQAVRCAGLDVGVHRTDQYSRLGKLTRQGRRTCAGRSTRRRSRPASPEAPTTATTSSSRRAGCRTPGPR
jgi:transposase